MPHLTLARVWQLLRPEEGGPFLHKTLPLQNWTSSCGDLA